MAQLVRRHRTFIASFVEDTIIQTSVTVSISNMHAKGDKWLQRNSQHRYVSNSVAYPERPCDNQTEDTELQQRSLPA